MSKVKKKYKLNKNKNKNYDLFINATPVIINKEITKFINKSKYFFDVKVSLSSSKLANLEKEKGIKYISGFEMYKHQLIKQLYIYTGFEFDLKKLNKIINSAIKD